MKWLRGLIVAAFCIATPASAWWQSIQQVVISGGGGGGCTEATTFLARVAAVPATLDATHTTAYTNLICGMVSQSATEGGTLWARFDLLFVYATDTTTGSNQSVALLNLPNITYTASLISTPIFTADRGFNNAPASGEAVSINFNPFTVIGSQYTLNSAHASVWNLTNGTDTALLAAGASNSALALYPKFSDNNAYLRINDSAGGFAVSDARGHFLGNRDGLTSRQGYQNAVSIGTYGSVATSGLDNSNIQCPFADSVNQAAMVSVGASLSATDTTNFYNLLRTYMTAVGVP